MAENVRTAVKIFTRAPPRGSFDRNSRDAVRFCNVRLQPGTLAAAWCQIGVLAFSSREIAKLWVSFFQLPGALFFFVSLVFYKYCYCFLDAGPRIVSTGLRSAVGRKHAVL